MYSTRKTILLSRGGRNQNSDFLKFLSFVENNTREEDALQKNLQNTAWWFAIGPWPRAGLHKHRPDSEKPNSANL